MDGKLTVLGIFGPLKPSHELTVPEFDEIITTNTRGTWLASRAELRHMVSQSPLETHDGRPGNRGCIVNVASNLSLVSRPNARKSAPILSPLSELHLGRLLTGR